jgi:peptide/nickel transport system substrate-binding protein
LKDATWSDGMPVTADDVVFSLDRITLPGAQRARTGFLRAFYEHQTAEAIDAKTVRVPLKYQAPTFVPNLASDYMKMYPKHIAEDLTQEEANQPENLIGSGPWLFGGWQKDISYTFDRNPTYFKEGRPFFDGIIVHLIADTARRIAALQAGQVRSLVIPSAGFEAFFLNNAKPPFDDERVRQAFYLALDRDLGIERAVRGFGQPGTFFSPGVVEDLSALQANNPAFAEDRAAAIEQSKQLLAEAGYPDGLSVKMNTRNAIPTLPAAEVAGEQMRRDVGIDIEIVPNDLATTYAVMRDGTHDISTVGTGIILTDPADILNQFYLQDVLRNPQNWQDNRIDELIDLQNRAIDQRVRQGHLEEIASILHTGKSHLVVYFWGGAGGALDYRIRNFHLPPTVQQIHKWDHVWFDPDREQPADSGYQP